MLDLFYLNKTCNEGYFREITLVGINQIKLDSKTRVDLSHILFIQVYQNLYQCNIYLYQINFM
jgi:hypothetical protein